MRLWFDEDLSPTLVQVANELGFEATCNRDRDMLGCSDRELRDQAQADGYVVVTDNASDFRPMYAREPVHPGLLVMPGDPGRDGQQHLARAVIRHIVGAADEAGEQPTDFLVNKLVEIEINGLCTIEHLP